MNMATRVQKLEAVSLRKATPRPWVSVISDEGAPDPPEIEQYEREGKNVMHIVIVDPPRYEA